VGQGICELTSNNSCLRNSKKNLKTNLEEVTKYIRYIHYKIHSIHSLQNTFDIFTTKYIRYIHYKLYSIYSLKKSRNWNVTIYTESTAVWNFKSERLGLSLVQEQYQSNMLVNKHFCLMNAAFAVAILGFNSQAYLVSFVGWVAQSV